MDRSSQEPVGTIRKDSKATLIAFCFGVALVGVIVLVLRSMIPRVEQAQSAASGHVPGPQAETGSSDHSAGDITNSMDDRQRTEVHASPTPSGAVHEGLDRSDKSAATTNEMRLELDEGLQSELRVLEEALESASRTAHRVRFENGLGEFVAPPGVEVKLTSKEAETLTSFHFNETGTYKTTLPPEEYPDVYGLKSAIKDLEAKIRGKQPPGKL